MSAEDLDRTLVELLDERPIPLFPHLRFVQDQHIPFDIVTGDLAWRLFVTDKRVQDFARGVDAKDIVLVLRRMWDRDECGWKTESRERAKAVFAVEL